MAPNLADCHPSLLSRFKRVQEVAASLGLMIEPTQGLRSIAEQDALWAQGRTKPGLIVTNARGLQSFHCHGRAIDFAFRTSEGKLSWDDKLPWRLIGEIGKQCGLEWGGDWKRPDRPHFQYVADGFTLPTVKPAPILVG